jgi:hypothetical protein
VIEVVIDELVIRGLSPSEARATATALEARLVLLAREGEATAGNDAFRRTAVVAAPAAQPAALGDAVAVAVWGTVSSGGGR